VIKEFGRKATFTSYIVPLLRTELSRLLHTPKQRLPMLFNGLDNPKIAPSRGDIDPPPIECVVPLVHASQPPNCMSIGSYVLQTDRHTNRHTDRPHYSVCSNRPHLAIVAMRPKKKTYKTTYNGECLENFIAEAINSINLHHQQHRWRYILRSSCTCRWIV